MSFCPWCGKESTSAADVCEGCGKKIDHVASGLTPQPEGYTQPQTQTPFASFQKPDVGSAFAGLAAAAGSAASSAQKAVGSMQMPKVQTGGYLFPFVISFFVPFFGFVFGAIMMASDDQKKFQAGKTSVIIALASIVLAALITGIVIALNC